MIVFLLVLNMSVDHHCVFDIV